MISDPIDIRVGRAVRRYRMMLGMSQQKLASKLGITFQQLQKYESGLNRVGASRLYAIAKFLSIGVENLFPSDAEDGSFNSNGALQENSSDFEYENIEISNKETLALMKSYNKMTPKLRKKILDLIRSLSSEEM